MALDPLLQAVQDKVPSLQGFGRGVRGGELEAYGNPVRAREAEGYIRKVTQASLGVGSYDPRLARNAILLPVPPQQHRCRRVLV